MSLATLGSAVLALMQKGADAEQEQADMVQYDPMRFPLVLQAQTAPIAEVAVYHGLTDLPRHESLIEMPMPVSDKGEAWIPSGTQHVIGPSLIAGQVPAVVVQSAAGVGGEQLARMLHLLADTIEKEIGAKNGADA